MSVTGVVKTPVDQPTNQIESIQSIIQNFRAIFDSPAFIFDGILSGWNGGEKSRLQPSIDLYMQTLKPVTDELSREKVNYLSLIGSSMSEAIAVDQFVDLFVAPLGSGLARLVWLSELAGVVFASYSLLSQPGRRVWQATNSGNRASPHSDSQSILDYYLFDRRQPLLDPDKITSQLIDLLPLSRRSAACAFPRR
jgi:hypothetical protein